MRLAAAAVALFVAIPAHAVTLGPSTLSAPQVTQSALPGGFATGNDMRGVLDGNSTLNLPTLFEPTRPLTPDYEPNSVGGGPRPPGVIPEPGTWLMFILGFGALGTALRRRRPVAA